MFDYLRSIKVEDTRGTKTPKTKNPEGGLLIRIFRNGEVYPSKELVAAHDLSYKNKNEENKGNGYDVVLSTGWEPVKSIPKTLFLAVVPKAESKVDLFQRTRYDENGEPVGDVMSQGTVSDDLLNACIDMGWFGEHTKYIDLQVYTDHPFTTENKIYYFPKTVSTGPEKGRPTYVRRENVVLYPVNSIFAKNEESKRAEPVAQNELVTS